MDTAGRNGQKDVVVRIADNATGIVETAAIYRMAASGEPWDTTQAPEGSPEHELYRDLKMRYDWLSLLANESAGKSQAAQYAVPGTGKGENVLALAERACWYRLRDLYSGYRAGNIDAETCKREKVKALLQLQKDEKDWYEAREVRKFYAEFWKRIEAAGSLYAKEPTVEHADGFYKAVYCVDRKSKGRIPGEAQDAVRSDSTGATGDFTKQGDLPPSPGGPGDPVSLEIREGGHP